MSNKKSTSFSIGEHFEAFISDQVATGRYTSASEVIRESLRQMEERYINSCLCEIAELSIQSGIAEWFTKEEFIKRMKEKHGIQTE